MGRQRSRPSRRVDRDVQAIGALTQAVLDGDDLEHLLGRIAAEARVLVDAVSGVVVTVSDAGEMNFRGVAGLSIGPLKVGHIMPVRDTLTELALTKATNIVARDVGEIPEAGRAFAAATGTGPLIASPLAQIGSARGVLVVARTVDSPPFGPADISLISTFAAQAASAIELFELRSAEHGVEVRAERLRIAGELHDGVVSALRDLQAGVRGLADGTDDTRLVAGIGQAVAQLDGAIDTIGGYVVELRGSAPPSEAGGASPAQATSDASRPTPPAPAPHVTGRASDRTIDVIGELARTAARDAPTDEILQALVHELVERADCPIRPGRNALRRRQRDLRENPRWSGPSWSSRRRHDPDKRYGRGPGDRPRSAGRRHLDHRVRRYQVPPPSGQGADRPDGLGAAGHSRSAVRRHGDRSAGRRFALHGVGGQADRGLRRAGGDRARVRAGPKGTSIERDLCRARSDRSRAAGAGHPAPFRCRPRASGPGSTVPDASVRASLQAAVEGLDRAIRDLRRFVFGLGPGPAADPRVAERLESLVADNARLQAEIEAQLDEVKASRTRIIAAGDAERKRVERDLHDGAQQRLVSLTLAIRLARASLGDDLHPSAKLSLDQASADAKAALSELRELARGIHPQILTQAGLGPAVDSLAARSPVDVRVEIGTMRFSPMIEGAVYFTISEALTNIAKYAEASGAIVRADYRDDELTVEIIDDGIGGADATSGTGLRGLADRLESIDGSLEVVSPAGGGTRLVARIPVPTAVATPA